MSHPLRFHFADGAYPDMPVVLVADRTLFHDMFRKSYGHREAAEWLLAYLTWRGALDLGTQVIETASSVLAQVRSEFKQLKETGTEGYPLPKLVAAVQAFVREVQIPSTTPSKHAVLYVAKMEVDKGVFPFIVASMDHATLLDRAQKAGLTLRLEGFTPTMSLRRLDRRCWFIHVTPQDAPSALLLTDPLFETVVERVGRPPPRPKQPPTPPKVPSARKGHR